MTAEVPLTRGAVALIDATDAPLLAGRSWQLSNNGYAVSKTTVNARPVALLMHRVILGAPSEMFVDHINGNRLDNRRANLRLVTPAQNCQNKQRKSPRLKCPARGVTWCRRRQSFAAAVKVNGKLVYYQRFQTMDEADAAARDARARYMPYSAEAELQTQTSPSDCA